MDDLEKQLMDMSGLKEEDVVKKEAAPSVVHETVGYGSIEKSHLAPVRTFSSDLADAVREHGGSVVRVAIAEDEKHRREFQESSIRSRKNIAFIVGGIVIVLGAIGAIAWGYERNKQASIVVPVVPEVPSSLVASDDSRVLDIGGSTSAFYDAVHDVALHPTVQPGGVENIIITKTAGGIVARPSASEFLTALRAHASDDFLRSLGKEYMLGLYVYDRANLFLVLRGTAHDYLLSGMLAWEPYLFEDMAPLFGIDTSGFTKAALQDVKFTDAIIGNRDARAVLDAGKRPLFYYSFIDQNTILMATDPKTLTEAVRRY
jgi:hypothetical protein